MAEDENLENMFIYDLPYAERKDLCSILDMNNSWEEVGGTYMNFSLSDLEKFRRAEMCEKSPTDRMLQTWGQQNNTILNLFLILYGVSHFQAMSAIKSCVPQRFHVLCESEKKFNYVFKRDGVDANQAAASKAATANVGSYNLNATAAMMNGGSPALHQFAEMGRSSRADEGATALTSSASKLNHAGQSPKQPLPSQKVPENFLRPSPASMSQGVLPKVHQPHHAKYNGMMQPVQETKKIMNDGRNLTEVSCEDNNPVELQSIKKVPYDLIQDFNAKAAEKKALLEREANQNTKMGNLSRPKMTGPENGAPTSVQQNVAASARPHYPHFPPPERERRISTASDASRYSDCGVPAIPYKELEEGTACWSKDNLLGRGGFGIVYKGFWKNSEVAVKKSHLHGNADVDSAQLHLSQTLDELKLLQSFPHDNILQIFAYSRDSDKPPCLVYQFMPNGSVEDRLQLRKSHGGVGGPPSVTWSPLSWFLRYNIALGTARALQYLHTVKERPLIHGDVKSANILLDKNFEPKLGDFGLAREGKSQQTSMKVSRVHGTKPYLPADYLRTKKLSVKVDTYSYGIVLFELCTGLRAFDEKRKEGKFLKDLVEETSNDESLKDQNLAKEPDIGFFSVLFKIAKDCVQALATRRPDMESVFSDLNNFRDHVERQNKARRMEMEMCANVNTPYGIQYHYDRTGMSPPITQPSLPVSLFQSQVPSGGHTMPVAPYCSLPSSPFNPLHSPVPSVAPSPFPSMYPHHSGIYRPPVTRPSCNMPLKQQGGGGNPFQYGAGNHTLGVHQIPKMGIGVHQIPKINVSPTVTNVSIGGGDPPPSYIEAISPSVACPKVDKGSPLNALIPNLSGLGLRVNSSPQHSVGNTTSSGYTESSEDSESSFSASTTHNIGEGLPQKSWASLQGAVASAGSYSNNTNSNQKNNGGGCLPLLSALDQSTGPPTAASKISILDM